MHERPVDSTEAALQAEYLEEIDLSDCASEPLQYIQSAQPHACLLAADRETLVVRFVSESAAGIIGRPAADLLDRPLAEALPAELVGRLQREVASQPEQRHPLPALFEVDGETYGRQLLYHLSGRWLVVEVEPAQEGFHAARFQQRLGEAVEAVQQLRDYSTMFARVAEIVKRVSGYDRVMIYRFDPEYNGEVIAEAGSGGNESFMGLRFPASDIPAQARALYLLNRVRMISDIAAPAVQIYRSATVSPDESLDLSLVDCRGVSPVHREYLRNMGVRATMSIAVVLEGRLWGLLALHHYSGPRYLDAELRGFLRFLGQVFSGHLALQAANDYRRRVLELNVKRAAIGEQVSETHDLGAALTQGEVTMLDLMRAADGAVVSIEGETHALGRIPDDDTVQALVEWIVEHGGEDGDMFHSDRLLDQTKGSGLDLAGCAGVLLVWIERSRREYVAWFRDEIERQVKWGGDPQKLLVATDAGGTRLMPRKSFAQYIERVRKRSEPWTDADVDAGLALRSHIKDVVLRRYQQVKRVNADLATAYKEMESFSYTVSHDLRAPLRGISGYTEILLADYGEVIGEGGREMLSAIVASTRRMNLLIDDLLQLAKVGVSAIEVREVDIAALARDIFGFLLPGYVGRAVELRVAAAMPPAMGDAQLLETAMSNLIGNAIKYSLNRDRALIEVGYEASATPDDAPGARAGAYFVRDNGMGFDQRFADRVFEMFTRLSNDPTIEGSGVGLALVQRVIDKHGGRIWVKSEKGVGTAFYFTLGG